MSTYLDARNELEESLASVEPDGPESATIKEAIRELDEAQRAEAGANFVNASKGVHSAVARLRGIVAGIEPTAASRALNRVNAALDALAPVAETVTAVLAGEPASAPIDSEDANENAAAGDGAAQQPAPPLRERARATSGESRATRTPAEMIEDILIREGGFVNHPADRGGATNFGVTQTTLSAWRGHPVTVEDVRSMTLNEAREIYEANYFLKPKIDRLPGLVQPLVFDMSINHGPGTAVKLLQNVLRDNGHTCSVDGGVGDETIRCTQAAADALGVSLVNLLVDRRVQFYEQIVKRNASQEVFLKGWMRRANEFRVA